MSWFNNIGKIFTTPILNIPPIPVVSRRKLAGALTAIAGFHRSGVSLPESFRAVSQRRMVRGSLRWLLRGCADELDDGYPLSTVMKKCRFAFPHPIPEIIKNGEQAGDLPRFMQRAAEYLNRQVDRRNTHYIQFSYFYLLLLYCANVTVFLSYAVIPTMLKIVQSIPDDEGTLFQKMMAVHQPVTNFMQDYLFFSIAIFLIVFFNNRRWWVARRYVSFLAWPLEIRDYFLLPGSRSRRYAVLAHCFEILGESLGAGLDFSTSLRQAGESSGSLWMSRICTRAARAAESGESPSEILRLSGFVPPDIAALFFTRDISRNACLDTAAFLRLRSETFTARIRRTMTFAMYLAAATVVGWHVAIIHAFFFGIVVRL